MRAEEAQGLIGEAYQDLDNADSPSPDTEHGDARGKTNKRKRVVKYLRYNGGIFVSAEGADLEVELRFPNKKA